MQRIDFEKLKGINTKDNVLTSSEAMEEFGKVISNFLLTQFKMTAEESAMLTRSMQEWLINRKNTGLRNPSLNIDIGDICFIDFGNVYQPELAYPHPGVILEIIGDLIVVLPITSSTKQLKKAFHPIDNVQGKQYIRKLKVNEGLQGLVFDSAVMISNMRSISKGRVISKIGKFININEKKSLFQEVKNTAYKLYFPKQYIAHLKLEQRLIPNNSSQ